MTIGLQTMSHNPLLAVPGVPALAEGWTREQGQERIASDLDAPCERDLHDRQPEDMSTPNA